MPDEVAPDLHRLAIPLPDSPLGTVNVYALSHDGGVALVDCGWNTPEAYQALSKELEALGASVREISEVVVTHIHPDHFGLAERLARESGARVAMHRLDAAYVGARYGDVRALTDEMEAWLHAHGVPPGELEAMSAGSLALLQRVGTRRPDVLLEGGETLRWGRYELEVIWTPGHSAGLVCLYEARAGILLANDHVLERISPHVGLHAQSFGTPLADYLDSLARVRDLAVELVLPGHGAPFRDLPRRVDELVGHHEARLASMSELVHAGEATAYDVSTRLIWRGREGGWDALAPFQRRMALTETIAHLEYLHDSGRLGKRYSGGVVTYGARTGAAGRRA